jgi:hypothetical protein
METMEKQQIVFKKKTDLPNKIEKTTNKPFIKLEKVTRSTKDVTKDVLNSENTKPQSKNFSFLKDLVKDSVSDVLKYKENLKKVANYKD